jgi:2-isopropylmalate synthase
MMPAREQHILRTFESIRGAKQVLLQLYSASPADIFREIVFKINRETIINMAVEHALLTRHLAGQYAQLDGTTFRLMYGVEGFSQADLDFTIELCSKVRDAWFESGKLNDHPVTLNVASTVECAPANHFADQVSQRRFCGDFPIRCHLPTQQL